MAVMPLHTVRIGKGSVRARFPGMIVYVRQCSKWTRAFRRFCEHNRLAVVVRTGTGGKQAVVCVPGICWDDLESTLTAGAWEVLGTDERLDELSVHPMLLSWHVVVALAVPRQASGAGPEKYVPRPKAKEPKESVWTMAHNAYRENLKTGNLNEAANLLLRLGHNTPS